MDQISSFVAVGRCSGTDCGEVVYSNQMGKYCLKCGRLLPPEVIDRLPDLQRQNYFVSIVRIGMVGAIAGAIIGAVIGYSSRPSVPLVGQLDFITVVTNGANLRGMNQLMKPVAETSFNYLISGAIAGGIIGLICSFMYLFAIREKREKTVQHTASIQGRAVVYDHSDMNVRQDDNVAARLRLLNELKNDGVITDQEYQEKKKEILDRF